MEAVEEQKSLKKIEKEFNKQICICTSNSRSELPLLIHIIKKNKWKVDNLKGI